MIKINDVVTIREAAAERAIKVGHKVPKNRTAQIKMINTSGYHVSFGGSETLFKVDHKDMNHA